MPRAVLADLHLGHAPSDLDRFEQALDEVRSGGADELVLLGDLFVALVGFTRFWDETVKRGLEAIARFRESGPRVVLIEGNRDFFVDTPVLAPYFDVAAKVHSFAAGGRRFLLEHGDLINRRDRAYLFWRSISKSAAARLWAQLLPRRIANRIVRRTEARLAETNFAYREELPTEALAAAARAHFRSGVDVILWGHFHRAWALFEGRHEAHVVPGWLDHGTIVWICDDGTLEARTPGQRPSN